MNYTLTDHFGLSREFTRTELEKLREIYTEHPIGLKWSDYVHTFNGFIPYHIGSFACIDVYPDNEDALVELCWRNSAQLIRCIDEAL